MRERKIVMRGGGTLPFGLARVALGDYAVDGEVGVGEGVGKIRQEALDESDLQKVAEKLSFAEAAIFVRMQELNESTDGHKESEAIREACKELLKIQTRRLKWPVPGEILEGHEE